MILEGEDVTHRPPNRRNVNMVFQDYALFPHMNVRRNMAFGLELKGMGRRDIEQRLDELTAFLELAEYGGRYPGQLSGGQRQRVALARALAPDPALLLLDEPLGALDAKLRGQVQKELKSIQRRTGKTFLFVTHDQDEALTMSDRIVVLNEGRVEQDGAPKELYFHPQSRFVAEFIGETNLLDGTVMDIRDETVAIDWFGHELRGHASGGTPGLGAEVTASVRLEKLGIHNERPSADNSVCGRVVERTFLGSRVTVDILIGEARGATLRAYVDSATAADGSPDGRRGGGATLKLYVDNAIRRERWERHRVDWLGCRLDGHPARLTRAVRATRVESISRDRRLDIEPAFRCSEPCRVRSPRPDP